MLVPIKKYYHRKYTGLMYTCIYSNDGSKSLFEKKEIFHNNGSVFIRLFSSGILCCEAPVVLVNSIFSNRNLNVKSIRADTGYQTYHWL